jgi:hypothetical protein
MHVSLKELQGIFSGVGLFSLFVMAYFKPGQEEGLYTWLIRPAYIVSTSNLITWTSLFLLVFSFLILVLKYAISKRLNSNVLNVLFVFVFVIFFQQFLSMYVVGKVGGFNRMAGALVMSISIGAFFSFSTEPVRVRRVALISFYAASCVFVSVNTLLYIFDNQAVLADFGRLYGTTEHPNFMGVYLVICLASFILVEKEISLNFFRYFRYVMLFLSVIGVVLTGSRTALSMMLTLLVVRILTKYGVKFAILFIIILGAGYFYLLSGIGDDVRSLSTENTRAVAWHEMSETFLDNWLFGVGYGMSGFSESSYLRSLSEFGILGSIPFFIFLGLSFLRMLVIFLHDKESYLAAIFLAMAIGGIFEGFFVEAYSPAILILFFLISISRLTCRN